MKRMLPILIAPACLPEGADSATPPDRTLVDEALALSRPEPLVELVETAHALLPLDGGCPAFERLPGGDALLPADALEGVRETWTGGCVQPDGTAVEGTLVRSVGPDGEWLAGEAFAVRDGDELELYFDGAIEVGAAGSLLFVDAAASTCGGPGPACADGPATIDLAFSLYPAVGYPTAYDVAASGLVAADGGAPIAVEGAWTVDDDECGSEPASGTLAMRRGERHAIEMDGATTCDGCAAWVVQGTEVGRYCGAGL